ncbi:casein kinase I-like isoform X2 [Teleopsis dalmanni]|nr:casein kinase I-like isoform X2 [Teleopsis dalmanni]
MKTVKKRVRQNEYFAGKRYRCLRKISSGAFGKVYLGVNTQTSEQVGIKLESRNTDLLENEYNVYLQIRDGIGIPNIRYFGKEGKYNALVMDLLGPSLEGYFRFCESDFSIQTICLLADQMIDRIEFLHSRGLIHRDIKPENFLTGLHEDSSTIFLVDYGLTKPFHEIVAGLQNRYARFDCFYGTMAFASINALRNMPQSKRDDIEAVGYCLLYFSIGDLPWYTIRDSDEETSKMVADSKAQMSISEICPQMAYEFESYFDYCKYLRFSEEPDYKYLKSIFKKRYDSLNCTDNCFDWQPNMQWFSDHAPDTKMVVQKQKPQPKPKPKAKPKKRVQKKKVQIKKAPKKPSNKPSNKPSKKPSKKSIFSIPFWTR